MTTSQDAGLQEREQEVAEAIKRFRATQDPAHNILLGATLDFHSLHGITVCERNLEPSPGTTTYRFSLDEESPQTLRVSARALREGFVEDRNNLYAPAAAFWYSRSVFTEEGRPPVFDILAIVGEHLVRATRERVEIGTVPSGTVPLSALAIIIAASPALLSRLQFTVLEESSGRVVPATYKVRGTKEESAPFGLGVSRVEVVRYDVRIGDHTAQAAFLAKAPHIWLGGVTGIFYGTTNVEA